MSSDATTTDDSVDSADEFLDYLVQYRICTPNSDRWGSWSLGDKKGGSRPDAAVRFVKMKNEAVKDGLEGWRVMEVRRKVIYP